MFTFEATNKANGFMIIINYYYLMKRVEHFYNFAENLKTRFNEVYSIYKVS